MSVRVESGAAWKASTPAAMIKGEYYNGLPGRTYDVSLNAKRFLMIKPDPAERNHSRYLSRRAESADRRGSHRRPGLDRGAEASRAHELNVEPCKDLRPRPRRPSFLSSTAGPAGIAALGRLCRRRWRRGGRLIELFPAVAAVPAIERRHPGARLEDPFRADESCLPTARAFSLLHWPSCPGGYWLGVATGTPTATGRP